MSAPTSSSTASGRPVNDIVRGGGASNQDHGLAGSFLGKYYMRIMIGKFERPNPFKETAFDPKISIFLPLPTSLNDVSSVDYSNVNLETIGDAINGSSSTGTAAGLRQSGNIISGVGNAAGNLAGAAGGAVKNPLAAFAAQTVIGAAQQYFNSILPPEQMTSALQQSFGVAPNPNPSVAFQGPKLRDFSYSWNLYPRNENESKAIRRLIKVLKAKALPNFTKKGNSILDYPDMCQLNFFPWDKGGSGQWGWTHNSIIRYKKCVMSNVSVSYTSHGTPAFFEGTNLPVSYQLQIEFKEIEYMLGGNWSDADTNIDGSSIRSVERDFDGVKLQNELRKIAQAAGEAAVRGGGAAAAGVLTGTVGLGAGAAIGAVKLVAELGGAAAELLTGQATT